MADDLAQPGTANLRPFKPGQSGNPRGRPPTKKARLAIRHLLPEALKSLERSVKAGEQWGTTLFCHYFWGKPMEMHALAGVDGEPLQVVIEINRTVKAEGEG